MDALLLIDTTAPAFSREPPQALEALVDRARGVSGVVVHVAAGDAVEAETDETVMPQIESVFGTTEDELVLVSRAPDVFEGVEDLAPALDDLGVERLIVAGGDGRGAVQETAMAAIVLGFEVVLVADGVRTAEGGTVPWLDDAQASGAVVRPAADVWLKM